MSVSAERQCEGPHRTMQANAQRAQFVFSFFYGNGHCHILYVCIYGQTLQTLQAAHCEADSCPNLIKQSLLISHLYMWLIVLAVL